MEIFFIIAFVIIVIIVFSSLYSSSQNSKNEIKKTSKNEINSKPKKSKPRIKDLKSNHQDYVPHDIKTKIKTKTKINSKPKQEAKREDLSNPEDFLKYARESGIELNKCSISMGFVINALNEIEDLLGGAQDCEEHKENLMMAAYVSRIGILDRVDKFPVWLEANFDITIPKSQTTQTKMKMKKAMSLSVERLKEIASTNYSINNIVRDMLSGGSTIQEFEDMLPPQAKMQIDIFCQKE